jgi:hypothetical protein
VGHVTGLDQGHAAGPYACAGKHLGTGVDVRTPGRSNMIDGSPGTGYL